MASEREITQEVLERLNAIWQPPLTGPAAVEFLKALSDIPVFALRKGMDAIMSDADDFRPKPAAIRKACIPFMPPPEKIRKPGRIDPVKERMQRELPSLRTHTVYRQMKTYAARAELTKLLEARLFIKCQLDEGVRHLGFSAPTAFGYGTWGGCDPKAVDHALADFKRRQDFSIPQEFIDWANRLDEYPEGVLAKYRERAAAQEVKAG